MHPFKILLIRNTISKIETLGNKTRRSHPFMLSRKSKRTPFKILSSSYTWHKWTHQKLIKNREGIKRIPRLLVNVAKTISLPLDNPQEFSSIFGRRTRNVDKGEEGTEQFRSVVESSKIRGIRVRLEVKWRGKRGGGGKVVGTSFESSSDRESRFVLREVDRVKLRPRN